MHIKIRSFHIVFIKPNGKINILWFYVLRNVFFLYFNYCFVFIFFGIAPNSTDISIFNFSKQTTMITLCCVDTMSGSEDIKAQILLISNANGESSRNHKYSYTKWNNHVFGWAGVKKRTKQQLPIYLISRWWSMLIVQGPWNWCHNLLVNEKEPQPRKRKQASVINERYFSPSFFVSWFNFQYITHIQVGCVRLYRIQASISFSK